MTEPTAINCRDACGASVVDDEAAVGTGWSYLSITRSWRCGACGRSLRDAAALQGRESTANDSRDPIDPRSRGHLKKETASTISAPSVAS